jgi:hypothetical protein
MNEIDSEFATCHGMYDTLNTLQQVTQRFQSQTDSTSPATLPEESK